MSFIAGVCIDIELFASSYYSKFLSLYNWLTAQRASKSIHHPRVKLEKKVMLMWYLLKDYGVKSVSCIVRDQRIKKRTVMYHVR